jgi:hypothetical protein
MKHVLLIGVFAFPLAACGTVFDPAKLISVSAQAVSTGLSSQTAREQILVSELQAEDEGLRFISKGHYSCGNPTLLAKLLDDDPAKVVKSIKVDKKFDDARKFIDGYLQALTAIANENKTDLDTVDSIAGMASAVTSLVPPPNNTAVSAAITALKALVKDGINDANIGQMKQVAYHMEPGLEAAVKTLKTLYPAYAATETGLYKDWNECALEKLVFIRDLPNAQVNNYQQYNYIFRKDGGLELDSAYAAYVAKRKTLESAPLKKAVFDQVVTENKKLIAFDLSVASITASAQQFSALKNDFQGAVTAVKPLMSAQATSKH